MKNETDNTHKTTIDSEYPIRLIVYLDVLGFSNSVEQIAEDYSKFIKVKEIHQTIQFYIDKLNAWNAGSFSPDAVIKNLRSVLPSFQSAPSQTETIKDASESTCELFSPNLRKAQNSFFELGDLTTHGFLTTKNMHIQSLLMSDSIVMHASPERANAFNLVSILISLSRNLLRRGTLIRGAMVLGRLHHSGSSIFGNALLEAIHLEQNVAKVPRILIQPPISSIKEFYYDLTFEIGHTHDDLVKRDSDGLYFIDPFSVDQRSRLTTDADGQKKNFYTEVREVIVELMERNKKSKEWAKTAWLANRFNAVAKKYPQCGAVFIDELHPPRSEGSFIDIPEQELGGMYFV